MCSAVRRRMLVNGTTVSRSPAATGPKGSTGARVPEASGAGVARPAGAPSAAGAGAAAGACSWAGAVPLRPLLRWSIRARTSERVMRPPAPLPWMDEASRLCSAMRRRTTGDSTLPPPPDPPPSVPPAATGSGCRAGSAWRAGAGSSSAGRSAGTGGAAWAGSGASGASAGVSVRSGEPSSAGGASAATVDGPEDGAPEPSGEMTARRVPTSTVSPSLTRISVSTPAAGDGTSESTLSVDTSKMTSSSATLSPTDLSQRVMVPSVTVSPSCGITMSANVKSSSGKGEHRLAERLRQGGVRLHEVGDLVGGGLPVDRQVGLAELLGHPGADHVDAEDAPGPPVRALLADDLHEAVGLADDERPPVAPVGVLLGHHVVAGLLGRLLGEPGERHLRVAVDAPGHAGVVDGDHLVAQDLVDHEHPLGEADVGQLRGGHHVAAGVHARLAGPHVLVHLDEPPLVHLDLRALEAELLGQRPAADGDHDGLHLDVLAVPEVHGRGAAVLGGRVTGHRHAGADVDAPLLEGAHNDVGDDLVALGQELGQRLEARDLGAEVGEQRGELAADGAAADDDGRGGQLLEVEHLVGGEHEPAVDVEAGDGARHRTGGDDHVLPAELGPVRDADHVVGPEGAGALERGHLALLEEPLQALPQLVDDLLLPGLALGELEEGLVDADAELLGAGHGPVDRRRLEELLGRDATPVQARAPDLLLLDDGDVEAGQASVQGRRVAGGSTADDDDIELLGRGDHLLDRHQVRSGAAIPAPDRRSLHPGPRSYDWPMPTTAAETTAAPAAPDVDGDDDLLEDEALVEEISIDGMCGVY